MSALALALAFAPALPLAATPAGADPATDVLDQQNAGLTIAHARCADAGRSLYQAFRPRATPLVAIAIEAREVPPAGDTAHLRIRAGAPDGPVVGETHVAIPAAGGWVRAEFTSELLVELDGYYVIEWVNPTAWWACRDDDPYARGEASGLGRRPRTGSCAPGAKSSAG